MVNSAAERLSEPTVDLVRSAQEGDQDALHDLMKIAWPQLYRWALVRTADPDEAKDLAQEAAIKVIRSLKTFRSDAAFSSWVYRIVQNVEIDEARMRRRRESRDERFASSADRRGSELDGEIEVDRSRLLERVRASFGRLTERQRTVFTMVDLDGLSSEEAAKRLDVAPSTVRVTLLRARRLIREDVLRTDPELVEALDR